MWKKRLLRIALIVAFMLLIPLVAMQFTNEVNWGRLDFIVAAMLLFGIVFLVDLIVRTIGKSTSRVVIFTVFLILLLLTWAELGVGLFDTPFAGD